MKKARVLFLIARVHGLKAHLLTTQDLMRLLNSRDLAGMSDLLLSSDYSTELSRVPTTELTGSQLEKIFYEKLSERWYSLIQTASGKMLELLEAYDAKLEVENLKKIIRAIHGNQSINDEQLVDIPRKYQRVNFPALRLAKTMAEVASLLRESPYRFLEERLTDYERYRNPVLLEMQLDKAYFENVLAETSKISDSEKIRILIGIEADLRNLQLIIESKYMKLEPQLVREAMIDLRYRLRKNTVAKLINADIQEIPILVSWLSYSELLQKAVELVEEEKIVEMENLFSQYFYSYVEKASVRNANSLVYVFCYLQLCLREARNLTSLAIGKQMKMPGERLQGLLLL